MVSSYQRHLALWLEAILGAYRIKCSGGKGISGRLGDHTSIFNYIAKTPLLSMRADKIPPVYSFSGRYEVDIHTGETAKTYACKPRRGTSCSFMESSKTSNGTGFEIWKESEPADVSFSLGGSPSIFQAEVIAIQTCIEGILNCPQDNGSVEIFSDRQAALRALQAVIFASEVVLGCHRELQQLAEHYSVTPLWIPSHSGIIGNEKADLLAKEASERPFTGPEPTCGSSYGSIKTFVRSVLAARHRSYWNGLTGTKYSRTLGIYPGEERLRNAKAQILCRKTS